MSETNEQKIARLERELASARSRWFSCQQEAALCRTRAEQAERDEGSLGAMLQTIATITGFDRRKPVSHLPSHVRAQIKG